MNVWDNFIYIYHLDKFCILPSMPDSITDSLASTFQATNALSRSAPVQSYIQSGPRTITFSLKLHRDLMEDLNLKVSNLKDNVVDFKDKDYIDVLINYLQACSLPKYNVYKTGSKVVDPPQIAIKMGNDIFIRGVISGAVSVTYNKPILDNGKYASVDVTIPVTEVDPYDAPTVAMVGGFRGITSTFKNGIFKGEEDSIAYNGQEYTSITSNTESTTLNTNNSIARARAENRAYSRTKRDSSLSQVKRPKESSDMFSSIMDGWMKAIDAMYARGYYAPINNKDGLLGTNIPFESGLYLANGKYTTEIGVIPSAYAYPVHNKFVAQDNAHHGIDISGDAEDCPILAWQTGKVVQVGKYSGTHWPKGNNNITDYGNFIVLEHRYMPEEGYVAGKKSLHWGYVRYSAYLHLKEAPTVQVGQVYRMGCQLGNARMGSTGWSSGQHLHMYLSKLYSQNYNADNTFYEKVNSSSDDMIYYGSTGWNTFLGDWHNLDDPEKNRFPTVPDITSPTKSSPNPNYNVPHLYYSDVFHKEVSSYWKDGKHELPAIAVRNEKAEQAVIDYTNENYGTDGSAISNRSMDFFNSGSYLDLINSVGGNNP